MLQQIKADAILSKHAQEEEQVQLIKQSNQIEDNIPTEYYIDSVRY